MVRGVFDDGVDATGGVGVVGDVVGLWGARPCGAGPGLTTATGGSALAGGFAVVSSGVVAAPVAASSDPLGVGAGVTADSVGSAGSGA